MDRKAFLILLVSLGFLLGVWYPLTNKLYPPKELPADTNVVENLTAPADTNTAAAALTNAAAATAQAANTLSNDFRSSAEIAAAATNSLPALTLPEGTEEQFVELENDVAKYVFTSRGGGIDRIELKKYPAAVDRAAKKETLTEQNCVHLNQGVNVPIFAALGDLNQSYALTKKDDSTVQATTLLTNGLTLTKTITLSTNYLFKTSVTLSNTTENPVQTPPLELVTGTATPLSDNDRGDLMNVYWHNGSKLETVGNSWFANRTLGCSISEPRPLYAGGDGMTNVMWVACANRFFAIAAVPVLGAPKVLVHKTPNLPQFENSSSKGIKNGLQASVFYPETILAPGNSVSYDYDIYAGPKEYKTLSKLGISNDLDLIMGFSGFFGFFSKLLLLGMNWVNSITHVGYGLAIIIITIIIKMIFWPLTTASTRSMKRMSQLQPEMNAIREKYKDDSKKMNQKLMEFMKENKVNPMGGCLPLLIQIPVFIGFYKMLMSAIELRGATFLWASDLSIPDTIFVIPGIGLPVNPLPLIMGASMLWQSSMNPPSPGMDPMQQKMFRYMPLIFIFFCYSLPSGLSLYWTVQNIISIIQMKLTKTNAVKPTAPPAKGAMKPLLKSLPGTSQFRKKK